MKMNKFPVKLYYWIIKNEVNNAIIATFTTRKEARECRRTISSPTKMYRCLMSPTELKYVR